MKTTSKRTYDKSTEWLRSESPWSQVIFTNLLGKKMQSHIYDFKGRFWNRKVQPSGLKYSARGSQNPSDLYVITLPSRIPALSWNMVRNNELNYRLKPIFTVYSWSLITISLNNKRINCYLSLFRCSINLKILHFVWFIANCAWSSVSPLLQYASQTLPD